MLLALLGPNLLGTVTSVRPGISFSPFLTIVTDTDLISGPTTHPLTDFLFLYPVLLALYPDDPGARRSFILELVKIPCFIANPSPS
jgi:hypothetical protein